LCGERVTVIEGNVVARESGERVTVIEGNVVARLMICTLHRILNYWCEGKWDRQGMWQE
jgi:hypothetical protein